MDRRTVRAAFFLGMLVLSPRAWPVTETERIQRLEMLADLWGKLYLFHPRIVTTDVDWNRALLETIPKVEKAANTDELVNALNYSLFALLDDPFLMAQKREPVRPRTPLHNMEARKISAAVGYLDATDPRTYGKDSARRVQELVKGLGAIQTLIVDLRFPAPNGANLDWLRLFLDKPQTGGVYVTREHQGWNEDNSPNAYRQAWKVSAGTALNTFEAGQSLQLPTVFVVNTNSYGRAANLLDCIQAGGHSVVMLERRGRIPFGSGNEQYSEGIEVWLQTSMLFSKRGNLGPQADYVTGEPIGESELISVGQKLLDEARPAPQYPFSFQLRFPPRESDSSGPVSRENRLLGLFKLWTVISYMDLHVQYASIDWKTALHEWIPKVEATETTGDYYAVLRRLAAQLNDSHIGISLPPVGSGGGSMLPIQLRPVEGKPVVVRTLKSPSGEDPPIQVGDEILEVNGISVEAIFDRVRPLISASTPGAKLRNLVNSLTGAQGKESVEMTVQNDAGRRIVQVKALRAGPVPPREPVSYKVTGDLGYINLDTLIDKEVEPALQAVLNTKGLILDMRGYPRTGIQWSVVPGITDKPVHSTIWEVPLVSSPNKNRRATEETFRWIDPHPAHRYTKPIVVLIDDRAQSAAEDFCIYLKNAKRATFVGSTTAGTNGNVTRIALPGGGSMTFTGMRVKFADGGRFQNIGIVPDVKAEPTIRGIRAGRDEVLEKGIEVLRPQL